MLKKAASGVGVPIALLCNGSYAKRLNGKKKTSEAGTFWKVFLRSPGSI
jgi:hypothetical protein